MSTSYQNDFYGWTQQQAWLLKTWRFADMDFDNLLQEIETMGRSEKRALELRLARPLQHLLKWQFQIQFRGNSWRLTIKNQRREITKLLRDNPSLASQLDNILLDAYESAKGWAAEETGLDEQSFPDSCPWFFEQMINNAFLSE